MKVENTILFHPLINTIGKLSQSVIKEKLL